MQRLLTIEIDLLNFSLSSTGDNEFFYGDNNQIKVILKNKQENEKYYVNLSGNPRGMGSYISELEEDDDGNYILLSEDFSGFLLTVGNVLCNIHITNSKKEKITTVTFKLVSKMSSDRNAQTVISQSDVKTLADVYEAADFLDSLNIQEIEDAVKIVESLDIDAINQAIEIVDELDEKSAEIDKTLADAKATEIELNNTITDVNQKLASGAFNGKDGAQGPTGPTGPQGPKGDKGDQGAQGIQGPEGKTGPQGPAGQTGADGAQGPQGIQGPAGADGIWITNASINSSNHLIITLSDQTTIDAGSVGTGGGGESGKDGRGISNIEINSNYEMVIYYTDATSQNVGNVRGPKGDQGAQGVTGETGPQGPAGTNGVDGFSPSVQVVQIVGGNSIVITDKDGIKSFEVLNGKDGAQGPAGADGNDYILTSADKTEIAGQVYAMFTNGEEVQY